MVDCRVGCYRGGLWIPLDCREGVYCHDEDVGLEPIILCRSGTNRRKRGLSGSTEEGAGEFHVLRTGTIELI